MAIQEFPRFANLMGLRIGGDLDGITYYTSKRGRIVFFAKAPPDKPPSPKQQTQRNRFRLYAILWWQKTPHQRRNWETITRRASLCMTGYNLFIYIESSDDQATLATLKRQTNVHDL